MRASTVLPVYSLIQAPVYCPPVQYDFLSASSAFSSVQVLSKVQYKSKYTITANPHILYRYKYCERQQGCTIVYWYLYTHFEYGRVIRYKQGSIAIHGTGTGTGTVLVQYSYTAPIVLFAEYYYSQLGDARPSECVSLQIGNWSIYRRTRQYNKQVVFCTFSKIYGSPVLNP